MSLWRESPNAWAQVAAASDAGPIRADILEKDYWATQVLRTLAEEFSDDFVFKGGTSLSKGYHCIKRFSEDIDILILNGDRTKGDTDRLMKAMALRVADQLKLEVDENGHHRGRGTHLSERLLFPRDVAVTTAILQPTVELEMGVRGSDLPPHAMCSIRPVIADLLEAAGAAINDFEDLKAFDVPVLHPGRTLVEKILMLHERVSTGAWLQGGRKNAPTQIGRHYHDIHMLLELAEVRVWLQVPDAFNVAVADHIDVCRDHFSTEMPPRPEGGYAMSDAFRRDFPEIGHLQRRYESAMGDLYIGNPPFPDWMAVIDTIEDAASLL